MSLKPSLSSITNNYLHWSCRGGSYVLKERKWWSPPRHWTHV